MTADRTVAEWERRLQEGHMTIGRDVDPADLADRYDVEGREEIVELTKEAARVMIDRRETQVWLVELDAAAERLGMAVEEGAEVSAR